MQNRSISSCLVIIQRHCSSLPVTFDVQQRLRFPISSPGVDTCTSKGATFCLLPIKDHTSPTRGHQAFLTGIAPHRDLVALLCLLQIGQCVLTQLLSLRLARRRPWNQRCMHADVDAVWLSGSLSEGAPSPPSFSWCLANPAPESFTISVQR